MGYVIAALIAVALIGGLIFLLVAKATETSDVSDAGDTDQLSDASGQEGTARFGRERDDAPDVARPVVGGEAEGERSVR